MKSRIKKLSSSLENNTAFYASVPSDIFYLSGFSGTFARIIATKKKNYFLTDRRYEGDVKKSGLEKEFDIVISKDPSADLKKIISKSGKIVISPETGLQDYLAMKKYASVEPGRVIKELRMIKDEAEIRLIKKAVSINEACLTHIVSILKPGMSEKCLSLEFAYKAGSLGADGLSFEPIIAFNAGSAVPHHKTSGTRLKKGSLILIDAGVRYKGYCSDLTRCVCFGIMQTHLKDIQKHYNIVRRAKKEAVSAIKTGALISTADLKARNSLKKQGVSDTLFTHSLGHGLGIDVHEPPSLNRKEASRFKTGMVVTCEPGIYMEGRFGIRIEDDYLVTKTGALKLGKSSDALIITD